MAEIPLTGFMELNKARFYNIIYNTTFDDHERYNIGTYKEKKLHIMLKKYFEPDQDYHEIPTNGYIADIRRDNCITEIETSGFSGLKPKLEAYLPEYRVTLVYPLAAKRYVSWIDPQTHEISQRRQSPKKANAYDALFELVYILPYVRHENLTILAPMMEMDEYRLLNGWSRDRKKGSARYERMPVDLYDILSFRTDDDYRKYIPENCTADFTVKDFASGAEISARDAYAVIKVLTERGVIRNIGKQGRALHFMRT